MWIFSSTNRPGEAINQIRSVSAHGANTWSVSSRAGWKEAEKAAGVLLLIILSTIFGKTFFKLFNSYDYYHAGCGRYLLWTGKSVKIGRMAMRVQDIYRDAALDKHRVPWQLTSCFSLLLFSQRQRQQSDEACLIRRKVYDEEEVFLFSLLFVKTKQK